jgi:hypothetical protein
MKILALCNQHHLMPFANRLRLEGHDVEVVVWKAGKSSRYERAWAGSLPQVLRSSRGEVSDEHLAPAIEAAQRGQVTVLTDSYNAAHRFNGARRLFPAVRTEELPQSVLRLGAWFDGEKMQALHGLCVDVGAWPGGLGAREPGGLTLVRIDHSEAREIIGEMLEPLAERLKSKSFRGLVQVGLFLQAADGVPQVQGEEWGWPRLHTHAFVSELEGFGEVLAGQVPVLPQKFVVVLPVSIPPWPSRAAEGAAEVEIEGLTEEWQGKVFWHDIQVDAEARKLRTAGLDGLVGVARGAGHNVELARARAIQLVEQMRLPNKQYRPDVASMVGGALAGLESAFGLVL